MSETSKLGRTIYLDECGTNVKNDCCGGSLLKACSTIGIPHLLLFCFLVYTQCFRKTKLVRRTYKSDYEVQKKNQTFFTYIMNLLIVSTLIRGIFLLNFQVVQESNFIVYTVVRSIPAILVLIAISALYHLLSLINFEIQNQEDIAEKYNSVSKRFLWTSLSFILIFGLVDILLSSVKEASMIVFAFAENVILLTFLFLIARLTISIVGKLRENLRNYNSEFRDQQFHSQLVQCLMIMAFVVSLYVIRVFLYLFQVIPLSSNVFIPIVIQVSIEVAIVISLLYFVRVVQNLTEKVAQQLREEETSLLRKKQEDHRSPAVPAKPSKTQDQLRQELSQIEKVSKSMNDLFKGREDAQSQDFKEDLKSIVKEVSMIQIQLNLAQECLKNASPHKGELELNKKNVLADDEEKKLMDIEQRVLRIQKRLQYCRSEVTIQYQRYYIYAEKELRTTVKSHGVNLKTKLEFLDNKIDNTVGKGTGDKSVLGKFKDQIQANLKKVVEPSIIALQELQNLFNQIKLRKESEDQEEEKVDASKISIVNAEEVGTTDQEKLHQHSFQMYFVMSSLIEKYNKLKEELVKVDAAYIQMKAEVDKMSALSFSEDA